MSERTYRAAIIGTGGIAHAHAKAVLDSAGRTSGASGAPASGGGASGGGASGGGASGGGASGGRAEL
ncbi:hypothetical protein AB0J43_42750, partial [Nonomuraea fuscirosea]